MHNFIIACIGHLENIGSISYADLSNADISLYNIKKPPHSLIPLPVSSEKPLNIEKLSSSWQQIQVFQNSNFHLKAQFLLLAT